MKSRSSLVYEARLAFGFSALLPALGLPAYALLSRLLWGRYDTEFPLSSLVDTLVILLPLASGLSAAHLMTIEQDENFAELRNSYPEPAWRLPVYRGGAALMLLLFCATIGLAAFRLIWGPLDFIAALLPALPPAIYLTGLSLLSGRLTRSYWVAAGVTMIYWFLEIQTRGQVTGSLYLFNNVWPSKFVPTSLNQGLQIGLGLVFFAINIALSTNHRNPLTRSVFLGR
jgi:hypothetical protein